MGYPMNSWSYICTWYIWSSHICTWHDRCFLCLFMVYMVLVCMYFLWMVILVSVLPMILFLWTCLPIISSSYIHVFLWKGVAPYFEQVLAGVNFNTESFSGAHFYEVLRMKVIWFIKNEVLRMKSEPLRSSFPWIRYLFILRTSYYDHTSGRSFEIWDAGK